MELYSLPQLLQPDRATALPGQMAAPRLVSAYPGGQILAMCAALRGFQSLDMQCIRQRAAEEAATWGVKREQADGTPILPRVSSPTRVGRARARVWVPVTRGARGVKRERQSARDIRTWRTTVVKKEEQEEEDEVDGETEKEEEDGGGYALKDGESEDENTVKTETKKKTKK